MAAVDHAQKQDAYAELLRDMRAAFEKAAVPGCETFVAEISKALGDR